MTAPIQLVGGHGRVEILDRACAELRKLEEFLVSLLDGLGLRGDGEGKGDEGEALLVLTSDHGTQLLDHGRFGKGASALHPFNTQIPLYIRHPDGPRGLQVMPFVQSHDLLPTVMRLLDVPYANVDGQDAWTLVTGEKEQLRDHVVCGWAGFVSGPAGGRASVRDDEWNYVTTVHQEDPAPELYHLPSDPKQERNLADTHQDELRRMQALLATKLAAIDAPEELFTRLGLVGFSPTED